MSHHCLSCAICSSDVSGKPWKSKGVPSHGRSSSITYMPSFRSPTGTAFLYMHALEPRLGGLAVGKVGAAMEHLAVDLDTSRFDDLFPAFVLGAHESRELRGRGAG